MGLRATLLMLAAAAAATSMAATQLTAAQTVQQSAGAQPAIVVAANDAIEPPPSEAFMGAPEEAEAPVAAESFHVTAEDICAAKVEEAAEEAKAQAAAAEAKAQAQAADAEARAVAAESENAGLRGLLKAVRKMLERAAPRQQHNEGGGGGARGGGGGGGLSGGNHGLMNRPSADEGQTPPARKVVPEPKETGKGGTGPAPNTEAGEATGGPPAGRRATLTHSLTHQLRSTCPQISEEKEAKIAEEIESIESTGNIHVAEERNQEVDRKGIGEGKELRSSSVLRTGADVVIKATGAAESDAGPPPVTAKDEGSQPNSSLEEGTRKAAEATPQPLLKDGDSAVEDHDEKDVASAAVEAASSKASAVAGSTLSQGAGK